MLCPASFLGASGHGSYGLRRASEARLESKGLRGCRLSGVLGHSRIRDHEPPVSGITPLAAARRPTATLPRLLRLIGLHKSVRRETAPKPSCIATILDLDLDPNQ